MELMVTISLMVFIISLVTVNYRGANKRVEIIMVARKAVSDLRLAQSYAASAKTDSANIAQNIWGVYLEKNQEEYQIFNATYFFNSSTPSDGKFGKSGDNIFRTVILPNNIFIADIYCGATAGYNDITVRFSPPDPLTKIYGTSSGATLCDDATIILQDRLNNSTKKVKVNYFGLIEENE